MDDIKKSGSSVRKNRFDERGTHSNKTLLPDGARKAEGEKPKLRRVKKTHRGKAFAGPVRPDGGGGNGTRGHTAAACHGFVPLSSEFGAIIPSDFPLSSRRGAKKHSGYNEGSGYTGAGWGRKRIKRG